MRASTFWIRSRGPLDRRVERLVDLTDSHFPVLRDHWICAVEMIGNFLTFLIIYDSLLFMIFLKFAIRPLNDMNSGLELTLSSGCWYRAARAHY